MTPMCNICGATAGFINPERGKEGFHCTNCSATSRNRLVMYILGRVLGFGDEPVFRWPRQPAVRILEPCPRGPQVAFLKEKFDYIMPEFDAEKIQSGADPRRYSDIQNLAFPDEFFDIVIASDVFEHVRNDVQGFREIYRTLKPYPDTGGGSGFFILTVPYDHQREQTHHRVQVEGERDILVAEARYAGGGGVTLDYREYGRDVLSVLREVGFAVAYLEQEIPAYQIYKSAVILCAKSAYVPLNLFLDNPTQAPDRSAAGPIQSMKWTGPLIPNRLFLWYKFNLSQLRYFWHQARLKFFG